MEVAIHKCTSCCYRSRSFSCIALLEKWLTIHRQWSELIALVISTDGLLSLNRSSVIFSMASTINALLLLFWFQQSTIGQLVLKFSLLCTTRSGQGIWLSSHYHVLLWLECPGIRGGSSIMVQLIPNKMLPISRYQWLLFWLAPSLFRCSARFSSWTTFVLALYWWN